MCSIEHNEYECTVGLVFDNNLFGKIREHLLGLSRHEPDVENVFIYARDQSPQKYRHHRVRTAATGDSYDRFDTKTTLRCQEAQVPYYCEVTGRIIFLTGSYKEANERVITETDWKAVRDGENHIMSESLIRVAHKRREVFDYDCCFDTSAGAADSERLITLLGLPLGTQPHSHITSRLTIGEYSIFGGTMEARTLYNTINYLEVEREFNMHLDERGASVVLTDIVARLIGLLGYELVVKTMKASNTRSVQSERLHTLFDSFQRTFINYAAHDSAIRAGLEHDFYRAYIMPKWDGVRATALYYDGHLIIRSADLTVDTINVDLPFDNDMVLQLEIIAGSHAVITEIMAVLVKSHNTTYQMYGKNNAAADTGRYVGNVSNSIVIAKQFSDHKDPCNLYRLVEPVVSLHFMSLLSRRRHQFLTNLSVEEFRRVTNSLYDWYTESRVRGRKGIVSVIPTTVICLSKERSASLCAKLRRFNESRLLEDATAYTTSRRRCIDEMASAFPSSLLYDRFYAEAAGKEGLIVAFAKSVVSPLTTFNDFLARHERWFTYGYVKVKMMDTVDMKMDQDGHVRSRDLTRYRLIGVRPVPPPGVDVSHWIIECAYDRKYNGLVFVRNRTDKLEADDDSKIAKMDPKFCTAVF